MQAFHACAARCCLRSRFGAALRRYVILLATTKRLRQQVGVADSDWSRSRRLHLRNLRFFLIYPKPQIHLF